MVDTGWIYAHLAKIRPCPFCGADGCIDTDMLDGTPYFTIGCTTPDCLMYTKTQPTAVPFSKAVEQLEKWNTRQCGAQ